MVSFIAFVMEGFLSMAFAVVFLLHSLIGITGIIAIIAFIILQPIVRRWS